MNEKIIRFPPPSEPTQDPESALHFRCLCHPRVCRTKNGPGQDYHGKKPCSRCSCRMQVDTQADLTLSWLGHEGCPAELILSSRTRNFVLEQERRNPFPAASPTATQISDPDPEPCLPLSAKGTEHLCKAQAAVQSPGPAALRVGVVITFGGIGFHGSPFLAPCIRNPPFCRLPSGKRINLYAQDLPIAECSRDAATCR